MAYIRTFIAVEISDEVRGQVRRLLDRLTTIEQAVRWVDPNNIHLTLNFLGDVVDRQTPEVCQSVANAVAEITPLVLDCIGIGAFPNLARPRTVWAGIEGDTEPLQQLQRTIANAMADLGFPPESRRYKPHLTLGRLKKGRRVSEEGKAVLHENADLDLGAIQVDEVIVFASELTKEGPIYTPMSRVTFGDGQG